MGDGLEDGVDQKAQWKGTCEMIWLSALVLFLTYEMLLGSFGSQALAGGGDTDHDLYQQHCHSRRFFAAAGSLVAGVCFAGLIAFCGSGLHYGIFCIKRGLGLEKKAHKKGEKAVVWLSALAMLLISLGQYYYGRKSGGLVVLLAWLSVLALCFPFFLMERKKRKRGMALAALCLGMVLFGCGCSVQELENKSFPMVMTLRAEDGDCVLTYKYMDLSRVSEKEKTKQGSDELTVRSSSVRGVIRRMDEKNGKILDLNHVKVLLLEAEFLEEKDFMQELVEIGNSGVDLPGNMIRFCGGGCGCHQQSARRNGRRSGQLSGRDAGGQSQLRGYQRSDF